MSSWCICINGLQFCRSGWVSILALFYLRIITFSIFRNISGSGKILFLGGLQNGFLTDMRCRWFCPLLPLWCPIRCPCPRCRLIVTRSSIRFLMFFCCQNGTALQDLSCTWIWWVGFWSWFWPGLIWFGFFFCPESQRRRRVWVIFWWGDFIWFWQDWFVSYCFFRSVK